MHNQGHTIIRLPASYTTGYRHFAFSITRLYLDGWPICAEWNNLRRESTILQPAPWRLAPARRSLITNHVHMHAPCVQRCMCDPETHTCNCCWWYESEFEISDASSLHIRSSKNGLFATRTRTRDQRQGRTWDSSSLHMPHIMNVI